MDNERILLGLAGDVMIGRGVNKAISEKGYTYPWGNVLSLLRSTTITIINLETTLTNSNKIVPKVFNFKATPDKVQTLIEAPVTAVSLANNHILDYDEEGLAETLETLNAAGIKHAGAGMNAIEAAQPAIIRYHNQQLGLLSFTDNEPGWKAGPQRSGINYINISNPKDKASALLAVQQLAKEVDIVVVSLHWGPNMREEPSASFVAFAHWLVDAGTDIIHGHSAHIFQGIEVYQNKLILYDTGDFVDDYIVHPFQRNDLSFFFLIEIQKNKIKHLQLVPVAISHYQVNKSNEADYNWSMQRMKKLSARFNTSINNAGDIQLL